MDTTRDDPLPRPEPPTTPPTAASPAVEATGPETPPAEAPLAAPLAAEADFIRFKRSHFYAALVPVAFVLGLAVGYLFWGRAPATTAGATAASGGPPTRLQVSADDDPALGPEDAPVVIIEFSDFSCPYCRRFHQQTFRPLLEAYPDQIRFVYRDFPILSPESFVAAQAAECAEEQDAFWEFHDALFSGRYPLGREAYRAYAEELGLDAEALLACVDEGRYAAEVQADAQAAASLGVRGTPTFFINGIPLVGAQPLERFQQVIDGELQRDG